MVTFSEDSNFVLHFYWIPMNFELSFKRGFALFFFYRELYMPSYLPDVYILWGTTSEKEIFLDLALK